MTLAAELRVAQRIQRTELACARALLDALEALLDAQHEERMRCDVVVQVADQLARVASVMRQWKARPCEGESSGLLHDHALEVLPRSRGVESEPRGEQMGDLTGPREGTGRVHEGRASGALMSLARGDPSAAEG